MVREHESLFAFNRAFEMPEFRLSYATVKYLREGGLLNGSRSLRKMNCRRLGALVSTGVEISTFRVTFSASSLHRIKHIVEDHDAVSRRTARMGCGAHRHTIRHLTKFATFFRSLPPLHLELAPFERFVFVMLVLENYSEHECSVLLGCSRRDVIAARIRALQQTGSAMELQIKQQVNAGSGKPRSQDNCRSVLELQLPPRLATLA
jgi:hypothetical protein